MTVKAPSHSKSSIFITGAGRNLGAFLTRQWLKKGYAVIAHYRTATNIVAELEQLGAICIQANFNGPQAIEALAKQVENSTSNLRAIVHNASAFAPTQVETAASAQQFQDFFNVHMLAPFLLNNRLAPQLKGSPKAPADIIHIADIYADNPAVIYDSYCASKAGLQSLALAAAKKWAPTVKSNVIQPGPVDFKHWHSPDHQSQVVDSTLLKKVGGPEVIYQAITAIMDNPFMTGAIVPVDGGRRLQL